MQVRGLPPADDQESRRRRAMLEGRAGRGRTPFDALTVGRKRSSRALGGPSRPAAEAAAGPDRGGRNPSSAKIQSSWKYELYASYELRHRIDKPSARRPRRHLCAEPAQPLDIEYGYESRIDRPLQGLYLLTRKQERRQYGVLEGRGERMPK
jgi:hypothetical protein